MFYYELNGKILISDVPRPGFNPVPESLAVDTGSIVYMLNSLSPLKSRKRFCISHPSLAFLKEEGLELIKAGSSSLSLPPWLISKIESGKVGSLNIEYPTWQESLDYSPPEKWRVNVVGLGDVGGILVTGLRLLGGDCISRIGIYDRDENRIKRWAYEAGQIMAPFSALEYPQLVELTEDKVFDCDIFVFCVSVGVPPVGGEDRDVRMAQYKGNSSIAGMYAEAARLQRFKGIFAVVSDPVDLLCRDAFLQSNRSADGSLDFKGLAPDQLRGYGLGVMNARAAYYARLHPETSHYLEEGRAFGPHGKGLVIADSIKNYNHELSIYLTEKAMNANLDVRAAGFKPYIAPALSSGALSIIATIKGNWHYSATFMGGVFMGSKNRLKRSGTEIETLNIPSTLWERLKNTYDSLGGTL